MSSPANSLKTVFFALGANFGIAVIKLCAAIYTGSGSMLAETLHSFADCGNQGLLLVGMRQAKLPPSPLYPLGRGARMPFYSFLVAVLLFSVGGLFSIYEGWHKLHVPEPLRSPFIALIVLAISIVLEGTSLATALKEVGHVQAGRSLWRWFRESRQSELIVVIGEDIAALSGLVIAGCFIGAAMLTGKPVFDAVGSIAIGILLVITAIGVGREVGSILMGESAEPAVRNSMI
jgi:cation diffusion facilitator family transporter